ncbi:MAG: trypsin-like peptidase domain-containing protein [Parcubacteria group bacterium]|nr:trypsin-like peptidase domain-containing protein [Parcubacteria group bacterium]
MVVAAAITAGFVGGYVANQPYWAYGLSGSPATPSIVKNERPLVIPKTSFAQEEAVISIVKKYSPAVVSVIVSKDVPVVERCYISPFGEDPFFKQFFGDFLVPSECQNGFKRQEVGGGTGFVISADGLIVTNKHVVADTKAEYTVLTNDEKKYPAKVLARDPLKDLAIIKIEAANLPTVVLGDSNNLEIGQTVIAIGNALGEFRNTVSMGIISGLARTIVASGGGVTEELRNIIQTDAAINPGNSGGPLLNLKGEVIGVNVAVAQGAQGVSFALPVNEVKKSINSVKAQGRIVYPYIGIRYVTLNEAIKKENNLPVSEGAWLKPSGNEAVVVKDSPAEKAGLKAGDIITEVNGEKLTSKNILSDVIQKYIIGQTINLKILRSGQTLTIPVKLEERKF